jgi:competence protein CoiA
MKLKFALVGVERREAQRGLSAVCPVCGDPVIAKCGNIRRWHWAHRGHLTCDPWWEETEWHRGWKGEFPEHWQEVIHRSESGEKHIADVKTESGIVLELQHSALRPEERDAREDFYPAMVWVVDGLRLKRDRAQFFASLNAARVVNLKPLTFTFPLNKGALLRDWTARRVPVFFDFGHTSELRDVLRSDEDFLWRLDPGSPSGVACVSPVSRTSFLRAYLEGLPLKGIDHSAIAPALAFVQRRTAS